jgi:hypothetical protein
MLSAYSTPIAYFAPTAAAEMRNLPLPAPKSKTVSSFASDSRSGAFVDEGFTLSLNPITLLSAPP